MKVDSLNPFDLLTSISINPHDIQASLNFMAPLTFPAIKILQKKAEINMTSTKKSKIIPAVVKKSEGKL
jgi:hypothetical protein